MTTTEILYVLRLLVDGVPDTRLFSPDPDVQDLIDLTYEAGVNK